MGRVNVFVFNGINDVNDVILVSLLLTLSIFHTML